MTSVTKAPMAHPFEPLADSVENMKRNAASLASDHGNGAVEIFQRSSWTRRVQRDGRGEIRTRTGIETGGAARWFDPRLRTVGFTAASGEAGMSGPTCRRLARRVPGTPVDAPPWNTSATPVVDADECRDLPEVAALDAWLAGNAPDDCREAWIEAAFTTEIWLADGGEPQVRARNRAWALWTPKGHDEMISRPLIVAARGWSHLQEEDVAALWRARDASRTGRRAWPTDAPLVFSAETSCFLVRMLAGASHRPGIDPGDPVGPGWLLTLHPKGDSGRLFGSHRDDAGFTVESRLLADGKQVLDDWGGPGSLRRGSFRDLPEASPVSLSLEPPHIDPPKRAIWISGVDLHPGGTGWNVRLEGREYPDGSPFEPHWVSVDPSRLLRGCLGGLGPVHQGHLGVSSPALVFEDGVLRGD